MRSFAARTCMWALSFLCGGALSASQSLKVPVILDMVCDATVL